MPFSMPPADGGSSTVLLLRLSAPFVMPEAACSSAARTAGTSVSLARSCSASRVHTVFAEQATAADGAFLDDLAGFVRGKQVFVTIDLDGLDPSIMPAVGTPEPGGLSWQRMLDVCRTIARQAARVPVFDVVELAPIPGLIAPDFLTAKLIYKIMSYVLVR